MGVILWGASPLCHFGSLKDASTPNGETPTSVGLVARRSFGYAEGSRNCEIANADGFELCEPRQGSAVTQRGPRHKERARAS